MSVTMKNFYNSLVAQGWTQDANGNLFKPRGATGFTPAAVQPPAPAAKRIRQSDKPLMNKLESEWFAILKSSGWMSNLRPQARRYRLANGAWYRPDMVGFDTRDRLETAYECKGPKVMKNVARGILTIKFAAAAWPEVKWILVWKQDGEWQQQEVLSDFPRASASGITIRESNGGIINYERTDPKV